MEGGDPKPKLFEIAAFSWSPEQHSAYMFDQLGHSLYTVCRFLSSDFPLEEFQNDIEAASIRGEQLLRLKAITDLDARFALALHLSADCVRMRSAAMLEEANFLIESLAKIEFSDAKSFYENSWPRLLELKKMQLSRAKEQQTNEDDLPPPESKGPSSS